MLSSRFSILSFSASRPSTPLRDAALSQRILQVDGNAVLPQQVGKGLVGQFLKRRHPVARKLGELVERVVVEGDQFAQASSAPASGGAHAMTDDGNRSGQEQATASLCRFDHPGHLRWIASWQSPRISGKSLARVAGGSFAQSAGNRSAPAPGTNSAGTAQSSGAGVNTGAGVTTGSAGSLGTGMAATPNRAPMLRSMKKTRRSIAS